MGQTALHNDDCHFFWRVNSTDKMTFSFILQSDRTIMHLVMRFTSHRIADGRRLVCGVICGYEIQTLIAEGFFLVVLVNIVIVILSQW